jgi:hypothetical protein
MVDEKGNMKLNPEREREKRVRRMSNDYRRFPVERVSLQSLSFKRVFAEDIKRRFLQTNK